LFHKPYPSVAELLDSDGPRPEVKAAGWVRTKREAKETAFFELNDGSSQGNLQIVINKQTLPGGEALLATVTTGASVEVRGSLQSSPAAGQKWELSASAITLLGHADAETYPLQKKKHSLEFLREIAHLRPRTNTFGAVASSNDFSTRTNSSSSAPSSSNSFDSHSVRQSTRTGSAR